MSSPPQWLTSDFDPIVPHALQLLVTGASRTTVARQLSISPRLLEKHLTAARQALGATTSYTLGLLAIRSGCINCGQVVEHAQRQCGGPGWTLPTATQRHILRLLATGASYGKVASSLGESDRTIRRRFRQLTLTNGTGGLLPAGALFEALGWHEPPTTAEHDRLVTSPAAAGRGVTAGGLPSPGGR